MSVGLNESRCVNTVQTYNFDDSMQVMRNRRCLELGVSSLYAFENSAPGYTVAGDACADIMIHYDHGKSQLGVDLVGPHDNLEYLELYSGCRYFGIRFLPGHSPDIMGEDITRIKGQVMSVGSCELYRELTDAVCGRDGFDEQCSAVLECLGRYESSADRTSLSSQRELAAWLLSVIIGDVRKYSLAELEAASGYSARYLNKVFRMFTGYSIAQFSNIIRAQRIGEYLCKCKENGTSPDYSGIAFRLDYTDQPHMIHEFEKHFGMAPMMFFKTYAAS